MKLDLWDEMMALESRVDDLFREILGRRARLSHPALPKFIQGPFVPSADVFRSNGDLVVTLDIPGIDPKEDVSVALDDGALVIKGEREMSDEVTEEDYYRMETSYGTFERHIPIPGGVDEEAIEATYADGILKITLPGAGDQGEAKRPRGRAILVKTDGKGKRDAT